jgi:uncharacterized protein YdhG (YjbR/CyaY superfamily)
MSSAQVTAHLKNFGPEQKKILTDLRDHIASKLPSAEQVIKYGIPTFLIEGVPVIGFDGYKAHNSIFPYSGSFNARLKKDLEKYIECSISKSENSVDRLPTPVGALTWKTAKQYHVPGAYAYIIKPTAAEQLVKHARSSGYLPVDVHINSYYVSIRTVTPSIFKICDFMLDRKNRVKYSSTKRG